MGGKSVRGWAHVWVPVELAQAAWFKLDYGSGNGFCDGEVARVDDCEGPCSPWHGLWGKERKFVEEGGVPL